MIRSILPYAISKRLFGDRQLFGTKLIEDDPDFLEWEKAYSSFYHDNQKGGLGTKINHYGFSLLRSMNLGGLEVMELGPGVIEHTKYWNSQPSRYILADLSEDFLEESEGILTAHGVENVERLKVERGISIPVESDSLDVVLSFHQLEHIYELDQYLQEIFRILRPGGVLAGAVPCEGGVAWGLGRFLTSRRYAMRNLKCNYDKIICWEHPNYVDDIQRALQEVFSLEVSRLLPFALLPLDMNLSWSFIARKPGGLPP